MMTLYINKEKVDNALIPAEINRLRPGYEQVFQHQTPQEQQEQLAEWARENVIEATLFRQYARKAFPQVDPQEVQNALQELLGAEQQDGPLHQRVQAGAEQQEKLYDEIADQIRSEKLHAQITTTVRQPSDKQIRQYYQKHLSDRFTIPETVHAAHIVKHSNTNESKEQQYRHMCRIKAQLDSGMPFEELAREHSDCPDNAGDLGFFARGKMVPAFEEVIFNLQPGACSDVFETEFGWHIARVVEKHPAVVCPLEQVQTVIVRELTRQAGETAIERFLDEQKKTAVIEER